MKTWEVGELYQGNFLMFPICAPHPVTRQLLLHLQSLHLTFLQEPTEGFQEPMEGFHLQEPTEGFHHQEPTEGFHLALTRQYLYCDGVCPQ